MIKNIFYSLILHSILLLLIFFSFKSKIFNNNQEDPIAIDLVLNENKPIVKKPKPPIKKQPKKEKTKKPPKPIAKPPKKIKKEPIKKEKVKKVKKKELPKKIIIKKVKKPTKKIIIKKEKNEKITKKEPKNNSIENTQIQKPETKTVIINEEYNLENLNLSTREKFNIKNQLDICYKLATQDSKTKSSLIITVTIKIDKEGYISSNLEEIIDKNRYKNEKEYENAINNARKTITLCNPLRNLPEDKYDVLKEINLDFGQKI